MGNTIITVKREYKDYRKNNGIYYVNDPSLITGDKVLIVTGSNAGILGYYNGVTTIGMNEFRQNIIPDTRTVANIVRKQSLYSNTTFIDVEIRSAALANKANSSKAYYLFGSEITPIETDFTFTEAEPPTNSIEIPDMDDELTRSYTRLFKQVQKSSDVYEIIKGLSQCSPGITLEQATKCNKLLCKTI